MAIQLFVLLLSDPRCKTLRERAVSVLNADELARYQRCVESVQEQYSLARLIAKTEIAKRTGGSPHTVNFQFNENGKPFIDGGPEFSISHCKSAIVIALGDEPLGVDVEQIQRERNPKLKAPWQEANEFINALMGDQVHSAGTPEQRALCFARLWTCLESQVKLEGASLFSVREHFMLQCHRARYTALNEITAQYRFASWQFTENDIVSIATCADRAKEQVECYLWEQQRLSVQPFAVSD